MSQLALYLLGPPRVELDGEPVHIGRRKLMALLAYLAVTNKHQSRETLAAFLAPEFDAAGARADLRRTLSLLNSVLGEGWMVADRETVGLRQALPRQVRDAGAEPVGSGRVLWLDVEAFRQRLAKCDDHPHPLAETCADCLPLLKTAVGLYQGDFLAGFTLPGSLPFDDWQRFESEALRRELASALERLVRGLSAQKNYEAAIPYALRWLELNLTHEPAHRALMELYARSGQTSVALHQYEYCAQTLAEELGVPPSAETRALHKRIRAGQATELYGVVSSQVQRSAELPHNLPPQPTPLVGRETELADLDWLIADPAVRLTTITGPGGVGKTRLALAAAERQLNRPASAFPHGVFFAALAPLDSAEHIVRALADALGFQFEGSRTPQQQLLDFLRQKRMLLILDNFEHLLSPPLTSPPEEEVGSTAGGESLVGDILETAPEVQLLVTSRERLQLQAEQTFVVHGLSVPPFEGPGVPATDADPTDYEAVELFFQSARRVQHDFSLASGDLSHLTHICQLVEGMPLGIELAASWVDALSLPDIAAEIQKGSDFLETEWRDIPTRHRSMQAVFDASWGQLGQPEQKVFAQLSVFRGGFTREAAQNVATTQDGVPAPLRLLARLANKSFLTYGHRSGTLPDPRTAAPVRGGETGSEPRCRRCGARPPLRLSLRRTTEMGGGP